MKNIVVAVDFSKGSLQALKYALNLAAKSKSDLTMVWIDNQIIQQGIVSQPAPDLRSEAKNLMDELVAKYRKKLKGKLSYKLRKGKVYNEIHNTALSTGAELIICGTHGGSGFEKYWIGSNAYRIVTHAPCPVITVKYQSSSLGLPSRIILPVDNSTETLQKLAITGEIAATAGAEIHVLAMLTDKLRSLRMRTEANARQAIKFLSEKGIETVFSAIETQNLTDTLIDYTINIKGELISIMTEQEATGTGALLGPNARLVINQSPVPVLSSHSKESHTF